LDAGQRAALEGHLQRTLAVLAERFDVDDSTSRRRNRRSTSPGACALPRPSAGLCLALGLFFVRFWGSLGLPVQVAVLVATPLLLLVATGLAARRERTLYYGSLLSLAACGGFVLNLNVLGTTVNLTPGPGRVPRLGDLRAIAGVSIPSEAADHRRPSLSCELPWSRFRLVAGLALDVIPAKA